MARRTILTERQRAALFDLPADEASLLQHYVLSDADIAHINTRRRPANKLGFALQLCVLRYPGRLLQPGELIPDQVLQFIGAQLGVTEEVLLGYATRKRTRYEHSEALMTIYGYRWFDPEDEELNQWIETAAENARSNEGLARTLIEGFRARHIIVPPSTRLERICASALVAAENRITQRIYARLDTPQRSALAKLLVDITPQGISHFVWLRHHEAGNTSRVINRLLDQLERTSEIELPDDVFSDVPSHRIDRLRRQGERYYADGLRDLPEHRRLAILAVCSSEWKASICDAIVESHDRVVGKLYRVSERVRDEQINAQRDMIKVTLQSFAEMGAAVLAAREAGESIESAVQHSLGWTEFSDLVDDAVRLNAKVSADPLDFVTSGYPRFRRYAPRMLEVLPIEGSQASKPLLTALESLRRLNRTNRRVLSGKVPTSFARPKWRKRLYQADRRTWETAVLFSLRDAFRAGDVWLPQSQRYAEPTKDLIPSRTVSTEASALAVPLDPREWIAQRKHALDVTLAQVGEAAELNQLPNSFIKDGTIAFQKLERQTPADAAKLTLDLYRELPSTRITDLILACEQEIGFSEAFTDLRTGVPCKDRIGLLNVILSDGVNLGLRKMAEAANTHTYWELLRIARWHIQDDAYKQALAMIIEAQSQLPMAKVWGSGTTASADGQFFPAGAQGEALNVVNRKYGQTPGMKAYTHLTDQYGPIASEPIPATAHEAPYILDGLVSNEAGKRVKEQYADTGGFTDHVFAMCSILGYRFAPRIRDLPSKRLYVFESTNVSENLRPLIGAKIREQLIVRSWPDILRLSASIATNRIKPSYILKRLSNYPRQNELALALREVGRVERSLFMLDWISNTNLQHRVQLGLNKGEAHHALKRAISFNRRGEIRDRTSEGQHYRVAGMNLLAALVIYWNTKRIGEVVQDMVDSGSPPDPILLPHVSPLGWEHINLTGEYRWPDP